MGNNVSWVYKAIKARLNKRITLAMQKLHRQKNCKKCKFGEEMND